RRQTERNMRRGENQSAEMPPPMCKPDGIPIDFADHAHLMFDLLAVAFQADLTRIATFMLGREGSSRAYREIGISDAHHPLTHHRNNQEMIDKVERINRYHMEQFGYSLAKLEGI